MKRNFLQLFVDKTTNIINRPQHKNEKKKEKIPLNLTEAL